MTKRRINIDFNLMENYIFALQNSTNKSAVKKQ